MCPHRPTRAGQRQTLGGDKPKPGSSKAAAGSRLGRAFRASRLYTAPLGLDGVHRISRRLRGVMAASSCWGVSRKPPSGLLATTTGSALTSCAMEG